MVPDCCCPPPNANPDPKDVGAAVAGVDVEPPNEKPVVPPLAPVPNEKPTTNRGNLLICRLKLSKI